VRLTATPPLGGRAHVVLLLDVRRLFYGSKDFAQVLLYVEPRSDRLQRGIGVYFGGIEVQLLTSDQARFDAQLYDALEELSEHR
jgi:hypothetical protein